MNIPDDFKTAIKNAFYDKPVYLCSVDDVVDDEGWQRKGEPTLAYEPFMANVRFDNLAQLQEDMGIREVIDVSITCLPDTDVAVDNIVSYDGVTYRLIKVIPFDSHKLLIGAKWLSRQSDLMSV
jgi:hypothetical protein